MTPQEFKAKWSGKPGNERQFYQEHFRDLCAMLNMDTPTASDAADLTYTFERAVTTAIGRQGFADVWKRGFFGWEYKGDRKDLDAAYAQLLSYAGALENPPLLIVSDTKTIRIHTNFTNKPKIVHEIPLEKIDDDANLTKLRFVFTQPEMLEPERTIADVTEEMAAKFGSIAANLQARGEDPHKTAHFLVQVLFCLFAEDTTILPRGLFSELLAFTARRPDQFVPQMTNLLKQMESGGVVNFSDIPHVNGGLFREIEVLALNPDEIAILAEAARQDWSSVEPAIFGTLFERSLDPSSRARLGAHYTGKLDILRVVEPVVMIPLRRRWETVRLEADVLTAKIQAAKSPQAKTVARNALRDHLFAFREELAAVRILDPACGSGNFLYVALERLLELDKDVTGYAAANGLSGMFPVITTDQLLGLEINDYARELAQVVIWIGYLQWMIRNGYGYPIPVLSPLESIKLQDALLDLSDPDHPKEAEWPEADYIIGNPPFLGGKRLRAELGDSYVNILLNRYRGKVAAESDLCCYFLEKARIAIEANRTDCAGLLATNSIRGGANREVLHQIKQTGNIFMAWSDLPWVLDGAAVRISIVGFDNGSETARQLDGLPVQEINSSLSSQIDLTLSFVLMENQNIAYMGITPGGPFSLDDDLAKSLLSLPVNPNGRPNSDVIKPIVIARDIVQRPRNHWVIDFGTDMPESAAALYEGPFEFAVSNIKAKRLTSRSTTGIWWRHERPRADMRRSLKGLSRVLVTPAIAKHRVFAWISSDHLPDHALFAFAREDDYFFGVLHSRAHEVWSLRMGTSLEDRPRYTPTTCFETFPLPWPPGHEPVEDPRVIEISAAAEELNRLRTNWLNPAEATEAELRKRTLTNLYNSKPTWLTNCHDRLNRAVWAAYGWPRDPTSTSDEDILEHLLDLNLERAGDSLL